MRISFVSVPVFTSTLLKEISYLNHGFFTRQGGVSEGPYESLSCKEKNLNPNFPVDPLSNILENRRRIVEQLGGKQWVSLNQKHSPHVILADKPFESPEPHVDAIVTSTPGLVISVLTADCVPVLLAARNKPLVAATHAGWKGAFDGVIENTLTLMREQGAEEIVGAIGPSIQQEYYEVGPEFHDYYQSHALSQDTPFEVFFKKSGKHGRFLFNLPKLVYMLMDRAGVSVIDDLGLDTYSKGETFFSYRRSTHEGHGMFGNQSSSIMIR